MTVRTDDRAVSFQIGAVFLFGILVIVFTLWQVQVVPGQNEQVEFNHHQRVTGQLLDVRDTIVGVPDGRGGADWTVDLGTTYPSRSVLRNPPPPTGTLRTVGTTNASVNVSIDNATAVDPEVADVWDGTARNFSTGALVYQPDYHEYEADPRVVYENTLVYTQYPSGTIVEAGQTVVDGNRITMPVLNGSLDATGFGTTTVEVSAASAAAGSVVVTNATGTENLTVTVPSRLSAATWESRLLADQINRSKGDDRYVRAVRDGPGETVVLVLEPATYRLQLARVGVGSRVRDPDVAYVTTVSGNGSTVLTGETQTLVAEVRDGLDNPVSGVLVNATVVGGGGTFADGSTVANATTGEDGRVRFTYQAPGSATTADVAVNVSASPTDAEYANFTVEVDAGGGGGGGAYDLVWTDPSSEPGTESPCDAESCTLNGSKAASLTLTVDTVPDASGQDVRYALNRTDVGSLVRRSGTTDASGVNRTVFEADRRGWVTVYATSGSSGDIFTLNLTGTFVSVVWETAADWDAATDEAGVVHAAFGDHDETRVDPGTPARDTGGSDLVAYWSFDGGSATDHTLGNDGTLNGNVATDVDGVVNTTAFEFDGSSDYVSVSSTPELSGGTDATITASAWFEPDSITDSAGIIAKEQDQSEGDWGVVTRTSCPSWGDCTGSPPYVGFYGETGGNDYGLFYGPVETDRWQHVAFVLDQNANTLRLYLNGTQVASDTSLPQVSANTSQAVEIGAVTYQSAYFDGRIDEPRVYDRTLSPVEVRELARGSAPAGSSAVWNGTLTTDYRDLSRAVDPTTLELTEVVAGRPPGTGVTVYVESDHDRDGTFEETSDPVTLDGSASYPVSGLSTDSDRYRLRVVLTTDDLLEAPTVDRLRLET